MVRNVKAREVAVLVGPVRTYFEDRPEDEFKVKYLDTEMTVQRQDIEEASTGPERSTSGSA
jgi:hypothetical protein